MSNSYKKINTAFAMVAGLTVGGGGVAGALLTAAAIASGPVGIVVAVAGSTVAGFAAKKAYDAVNNC